jgi:RNA recognition motif-containing protein
MQLVLDSNGKSLGEAFAEFVSESECALALKKDGEIFMRKQVAVKPIMKTEMLNLLRMIKQPAGRVNSGPQFGRRSTYYVKTENWPFTISIREVISFFQGFNPIQETVRVQIGNDMQGSAAMVGFRSQEDADRAVSSLNKKYYRQRPIRMEPALM